MMMESGMTETIEINETLARKVLETVDAGLVSGMGKPVPGQMCVEAAVCYAMGLPHSDEPTCVSPVLRKLKIRLNDSSWSSNEARTKGLRRLALVQLGSAGVLDDRAFSKRCVELAIRKYVPMALRSAASVHPKQEHKDALEAVAVRVETEQTREAIGAARAIARAAAADADAYAAAAAYADADAAADADAYAAAAAAADAYAAAYAAAYADADAAAYADAARDKILNEFAEDVVQILIEMDAPGCRWLFLTETPIAA
jgi:hypothetical protein